MILVLANLARPTYNNNLTNHVREIMINVFMWEYDQGGKRTHKKQPLAHLAAVFSDR